MSDQQAKLFLWNGSAVFLGKVADASMHKHHAAQVIVGIGGPFRLKVDSGWIETVYVAIPANYPHQLDASQTGIATALFDPASILEGKLEKPVFVGEAKAEQVLEKIRGARLESIEDASNLFEQIIGLVVQPRERPNEIDARIEKVLQTLTGIGDAQVSADDMAELCSLSQSRFLHLFTENLGLPFRRYVLWQRLISAINEVRAGGDLTTAAHAGGFADSAHFSRTFRETFGLSPSKILKNSQFVQVIT